MVVGEGCYHGGDGGTDPPYKPTRIPPRDKSGLLFFTMFRNFCFRFQIINIIFFTNDMTLLNVASPPKRRRQKSRFLNL